jgi:hypothetical protein
MTVRLLAAALLVAAVGVVAGSRPAAAQNPDPRRAREQVLRAFDLMLAANAPGGHGPNLQVKAPPVPGVSGTPDALVKVWARRYDKARKRAADELVALDSVVWEPGEFFVLCFQSTVPVQFTLANLTTDPATGAVKQELVLPNPREDLRASFEPIPAGRVYEMPFPLVTDDNLKDEEVLLGFFTGKHGMVPPPVPPNPPHKTDAYNVQARGFERLVDAARTAPGGRMQLQAIRVAPPPERTTRAPGNHDAVAAVVAIKDNGGVQRLTLRKRKPDPRPTEDHP